MAKVTELQAQIIESSLRATVADLGFDYEMHDRTARSLAVACGLSEPSLMPST